MDNYQNYVLAVSGLLVLLQTGYLNFFWRGKETPPSKIKPGSDSGNSFFDWYLPEGIRVKTTTGLLPCALHNTLRMCAWSTNPWIHTMMPGHATHFGLWEFPNMQQSLHTTSCIFNRKNLKPMKTGNMSFVQRTTM